jgi:hypothetical protein
MDHSAAVNIRNGGDGLVAPLPAQTNVDRGIVRVDILLKVAVAGLTEKKPFVLSP